MARDLVTKDAWETCKRNPVSEMQRVFSAQYVHSSYGWREITFATGSGSQEVVLQGYVRCKHEHKSHILSHLGDDGVLWRGWHRIRNRDHRSGGFLLRREKSLSIIFRELW